MQSKVIGISLKDRGAILARGPRRRMRRTGFTAKTKANSSRAARYMDETAEVGGEMEQRTKWSRPSYMKQPWAIGPLRGVRCPSKPQTTRRTSGLSQATTAPTYPYDLKRDFSEANGGFDILKGNPGWQHAGGRLRPGGSWPAKGLGRDAIHRPVGRELFSNGLCRAPIRRARLGGDGCLRAPGPAAGAPVLHDRWTNTVGAGQLAKCWLTADHGAATVPSLAQDAGIPVDYWQAGQPDRRREGGPGCQRTARASGC